MKLQRKLHYCPKKFENSFYTISLFFFKQEDGNHQMTIKFYISCYFTEQVVYIRKNDKNTLLYITNSICHHEQASTDL